MDNVNLRKGHRERLRQRFVKGDSDAHTDEAILELLLTYAIPQKDVRPLSKHLINSFGSFNAVLSANLQDLCKDDGIKEYSAILFILPISFVKITHYLLLFYRTYGRNLL